MNIKKTLSMVLAGLVIANSVTTTTEAASIKEVAVTTIAAVALSSCAYVLTTANLTPKLESEKISISEVCKNTCNRVKAYWNKVTTKTCAAEEIITEQTIDNTVTRCVSTIDTPVAPEAAITASSSWFSSLRTFITEHKYITACLAAVGIAGVSYAAYCYKNKNKKASPAVIS